MLTHRGIICTSTLVLYRSIRALWYDTISVLGWIGPVPLVVFVDMADSLAHGNFEQNNVRKTNIMK